MKQDERILVVLNPSSGVISKDVATSVIFHKLRQHFNTVSLINSNSPSHGYEITRQAMEQFDIIAAFGGDGTINSIASALINTGKTLGILPGGSGNGLVRNLEIPLSWRRALDVLIHGKDVTIDSGLINSQNFFNVAGVGLDGLISKMFNLESKSRGIAPYIYYAFKGYLEHPSYQLEIDLGDRVLQEEVILVAFANFRQYGGKAVIAPFASPYDKQLDLCIINKFHILKESMNFSYLFTGNIHKFPFYKTYKFEACRIRSLEGPVPFHFDGEYGGKDCEEYHIEVVPSRLKIRIPTP